MSWIPFALLPMLVVPAVSAVAEHAPLEAFAGQLRTLSRSTLSVFPEGEFTATLNNLPAGTVIPPHSEAADEFYFVVEGQWQLDVEGEQPRTLSTGQGYLVHSGKVHGGQATGPHLLRLLTVEISKARSEPAASP